MKTRTQIAIALCFVCLMALLPALKGQHGDADAVNTVTKLVNDRVKADLAGDANFIKNNCVDGYTEGTSFGTWVSKDQLMDTTNNKMNSENVSDLKVNAFGSTAIARFRETYDGMVEGQHRSRTIICTETFGKENGTWKQLAAHCSQAQ